MIIVKCDNCGSELRNSGDGVSDDGEAIGKMTIVLEKPDGRKTFLVDMDLCVRCTRKYSKVMQDAV